MSKNYMSMDTLYTQCDHGSDLQKVYLEESHGVINQRDQKPILNANDYKYPENIKGYGKCSAIGKHLVLSRRWRRKKKGDFIRVCKPELKQAWQDCDPHYTIEGAPVVLDTSCLYCARGGVITFVTEDLEECKDKDTNNREYSPMGKANKALHDANEALINSLPDNVKDSQHMLSLGNDKMGVHAGVKINPLDADDRDTEFKIGPNGVEVSHSSATQFKMEAEMGFNCGDTSGSIGTELEAGKIKSDRQEAEPAELKVKGKLEQEGIGGIEASKELIEGAKSIEVEQGENKLKLESGSKGRSIAYTHKGKQE